MFIIAGIFGVIVVPGLAIAARLGKIEFEKSYNVLGYTVDIELTQGTPLGFNVSKGLL